MDWLDALLEFVAALLGVLIGIPVALWLDRKSRESGQREKAIAVLSSIKEEINHNLGLLKQIQKELRPNSLIYYNMDMNTWRASSLEEFEGIISHGLLRRIFRLYYEYELMSRKIDVQLNMHYSVVRATKGYPEERARIVNAILVHAAPWEKESESLTKDIESELNRLATSKRPIDRELESEREETKEEGTEEANEDDLRHEERRGLFLLGLLAVLVAIRFQNEEMIVTFQQVNLNIIPLVDLTISLWALYALFMVFGLSEDVVGETLSEMLRSFAKVFLILNFVILALIGTFYFSLAFPTRYLWIVGLVCFGFLFTIALSLHKMKKPPRPSRAGIGRWLKHNSLSIAVTGSILVMFFSAMELLFFPDERLLPAFFVLGIVAISIFAWADKKSKARNEAETG